IATIVILSRQQKSVRQAPDANYKYNTNLALYKPIA
ncbi:hypothetical protein NT07LI_3953, partial [Listeria innocua FSL S4-378]